MDFIRINPQEDLSATIRVLNAAFGTVAEKFGFTKETNPTNNAFIDASMLREQLDKGICLYAGIVDGEYGGCIAIEKSSSQPDVYYIEKVAVLPQLRNKGYGIELINFATCKIKELGGRSISVSLIDSNTPLKNWYLSQGFTETSTKDFEHLPFRVCFMHKNIL